MISMGRAVLRILLRTHSAGKEPRDGGFKSKGIGSPSFSPQETVSVRNEEELNKITNTCMAVNKMLITTLKGSSGL